MINHRFKLSLKILAVLAVCSLPVWGSLQMLHKLNFIWPLVIYLVVSMVTFFIYRSDKRRAQAGERRFTENSLHLFELLGGWPGALLAQQIYRHKTRKLSFQLLFWLIVVIHQVFWLDWLLTGGTYSAVLLAFLMGR